MVATPPNDKRERTKIGVIVAGSAPPIEGYKEGLAELGWIENVNVNLEIRVAQGDVVLLPKGANPAELPISAALRHELIINLKTARKLCISIPVELLSKAGQVID